MKKVLVLTLAISLIVAGIAFATVLSTKHDMRGGSSSGQKYSGTSTTQVCVFCHHPHRGANSGVSNALLWNVSDGNKTYDTYAKTSTINSTGIDGNFVNTTNPNTSESVYTLLCMGCHDGGGSSNSRVTDTEDGGLGTIVNLGILTANLGSTLGDDHPVDFAYPRTAYVFAGSDIKNADADTSLGTTYVVSGSTTGVKYPLFGNVEGGTTGTMQCATCHDVHNGQSGGATGIQFMRGGTTDVIANSGICRDCHTAK